MMMSRQIKRQAARFILVHTYSHIMIKPTEGGHASKAHTSPKHRVHPKTRSCSPTLHRL